MSYYNRPWRGAIEVRATSFEGWIDGTGLVFGSVEAARAAISRSEITDLYWRIVDAGGNEYESGRFPARPDREDHLHVEEDSNHILVSERRRLLEEALA